MDTNPYDSPAIDPLDEPAEFDLPPTRPIGVAILAVLHGLGGLALGAMLIVLIVNARENLEWFEQKGLPFAWFATFSTLFVLLALASSIGMWCGTKWSWWLAAFYYFFMLFGDVVQLLLMTPLKFNRQDYDGALAIVMRQGIGALICFSLLRYLLQPNVLRFFELSTIRKLRALGILFGLTLVLIVALTTMVFVQLIRHGPPRARLSLAPPECVVAIRS